MTILAREVLADASRAVEDFEAAGFTQYWRTRWVAVVGLLRAVGHVLKEVDTKNGTAMRKAIRDEWDYLNQSKPEPRILWDFILDERNNILKAYQFGAHLNITVTPGSVGINLMTGEQWSTPGDPASYGYFMKSGPFEGQDPVKLAQQAMAFWAQHLDAIDAAAS